MNALMPLAPLEARFIFCARGCGTRIVRGYVHHAPECLEALHERLRELAQVEPRANGVLR